MEPPAISLFAPPYHTLDAVPDLGALHGGWSGLPGISVLWSLEAGDWGRCFEQVRKRPGGVALVVMLPRAEDVAQDREVLRVVEQCRPQSILPSHPEASPSDLRSLLCRTPEDLAIAVTDYLAWRGVVLDGDTRRLVRRTIDLAGEIRSVTALARSLYVSRRALGRRFLTKGLPVPSHWLHFGRVLRAVLRLPSSEDTLFSIACDLGYPDGFAVSNQMQRLTGIRPTAARECLGWEWVVEMWLRKEAEEGGFCPNSRPARKSDTQELPPQTRAERGWRSQADRKPIS